MIFGVCMLAFGSRLINWLTGFLLFLTFATLMMAFWMMIVFQAAVSMQKLIISTSLSVIFAIILTYFVTKSFVKFGVGMLGGWTALSIMFLVVPFFGLESSGTGNSVRWAIYIVFGLIGFVLGVWKSESVKIYMTAFIGSFFFMRGIAVYAGGFPDEFAMVQGEIPEINYPAFIGYCIGILFFTVLSIFFQKRYCNDDES